MVENPTDVFLKSSNFRDHLFWAWHHQHSSPISCLLTVEFLNQGLASISHFWNLLFFFAFFFFYYWNNFINWITMTRKSSKRWHMTYRNTRQLFRPHQQCIPWSKPLEIKPATTDCRAKTLQLNHKSISHTSDTKLTSHSNCAAN